MIFLQQWGGLPKGSRLKPLVIVILLFFRVDSFSQVYPLYKYSVNEGLNHSNVFRIMEDHNGFLWFSTNNGFSSFDGKSFRNYTSKEGLSNAVIMSVAEMSDGDKLINTFGGLYRFHKDSLFYETDLSAVLPQRMVYSLQVNDVVWCVGLRQIYEVYRVKGKYAERLHIKTKMIMILV
jgi:ligand-binding sensor domain-containing protein